MDLQSDEQSGSIRHNVNLNPSSSKPSCPSDLVELAEQIRSCETYVNANACARLHLIVDQMKHLKAQAEAVLREMQQDVEIHNLPCNFLKKPGNIYHVYERNDGSRYLGFLSPSDWGSACPHRHIGSYKLMPDMTWIPETKLEEYENTDVIVRKLLSSSGALSIEWTKNKT